MTGDYRQTLQPLGRFVASLTRIAGVAIFGCALAFAQGGVDSRSDPQIDISLTADVEAISVSDGGKQCLSVCAGPAAAGDLYLILGSMTGTGPFPHPDIQPPLDADLYFAWTLVYPNQAPLSNSFGQLNENGKARAKFALPPGSDPSLAGINVYHAAVIMKPSATSLVDFVGASNPVSLRLLP